MAQGTSGRVVIDLDPDFKEQIYNVLKDNGLSMKEWFLREAKELCDEHLQPTLALEIDGQSNEVSEPNSQ